MNLNVDQLKQQLEVAYQEITAAKSKAFDTITGVNAKLEEAVQENGMWKGVLEKIANILEMENPSIQDMYTIIQDLVKLKAELQAAKTEKQAEESQND